MSTVAPVESTTKTEAPAEPLVGPPEGRTTIFALAYQLYDVTGGAFNKATARRVTDGLKMEPAPTEVNKLHFLTPGQVAGLNVNLLWVQENEISGFQRPIDGTHARRMAAAKVKGNFLPPILVGLDHDGLLWVIDGDHRCVAGVISSTLTPAVVIGPMTMEAMAKIFGDQGKAKRLTREHHIALGQTPSEEYIAMVQVDENHPWYPLAAFKGARNRMSLTTAHELAVTYATGRSNRGRRGTAESLNLRDWNEKLADELATLLIPVLGNRNDAHRRRAWESSALRGLVAVARKGVRDDGSHMAAIRRFQEHMATFPWQDYSHLHRASEWEFVLTKHWNKYLRGERRLPMPLAPTR